MTEVQRYEKSAKSPLQEIAAEIVAEIISQPRKSRTYTYTYAPARNRRGITAAPKWTDKEEAEKAYHRACRRAWYSAMNDKDNPAAWDAYRQIIRWCNAEAKAAGMDLYA